MCNKTSSVRYGKLVMLFCPFIAMQVPCSNSSPFVCHQLLHPKLKSLYQDVSCLSWKCQTALQRACEKNRNLAAMRPLIALAYILFHTSLEDTSLLEGIEIHSNNSDMPSTLKQVQGMNLEYEFPTVYI